jgi:23S rRNA (cytidine1920-2'-O)/16S rRNA (cytidine1409-2'-O)-methyltransferase
VIRRRLDEELVRRGLAASRSEAQEVVRAGLVTVGGAPAVNPASLVALDRSLRVVDGLRPFASRGGVKLHAALERFAVDPAGLMCLDAGASTGGFTDCLLRAGAAHVTAVDVGYGQLAWELRSDPRVTVLERTNVRTLTPQVLDHAPDLITADLSFISLLSVLPTIVRVATERARFVVLVKPQFEAPPGGAPGGVVRDPAVWRRVLEQIAAGFARAGGTPLGVMASPLLGPAGNAEFFLHARRGARGSPVDILAAIVEAEELCSS